MDIIKKYIEKIGTILALGAVLIFTPHGHTKSEDGVNHVALPRLWMLNPTTLSEINTIPKISESQSDNEKLIIKIIQLIQAGNLLEATDNTKHLIQSAPNYALAQLLYADLLRLQTSINSGYLDGLNNGTSTANISIKAISSAPAISAAQQELSFRLKALSINPGDRSIPKHIISIANQYRQLIVADTKIGRIFIFDILPQNSSARFKLKHSFFMTIGDQGAGKMIEGDKKTPLGIYQLLNRVPQNLLTDLYGLGAIQTNYPNPVDRLLGKTGYGIWFHGTPSQVYVRYPFASDGCLVVSNDDMSALLTSTTPQRTLVIIDDGIEWVQSSNLQSNNAEHPIYKKISETFTKLSDTRDYSALNQLYEGGFKWEYRLLRLIQTMKSNKKKIKIDNISLIEWSKDQPYIMAEFDFKFSPESKGYRIRQYWMPNQNGWKIVSESIF